MNDKKRKKSGNEFRREKKIKDMQESAKLCSKITSYYVNPSLSSNTGGGNQNSILNANIPLNQDGIIFDQ